MARYNTPKIKWTERTLRAEDGTGIKVRIANAPGSEQYSREQLLAAFESVQNRENWKYPVDAIIRATEREIVQAAILFFTASEPSFTDIGLGQLRVTAAGYYSAVGA